MSLNKVATLVSFSCRTFRAFDMLIWRIAKGVQYSVISKLQGSEEGPRAHPGCDSTMGLTLCRQGRLALPWGRVAMCCAQKLQVPPVRNELPEELLFKSWPQPMKWIRKSI